MKYYAVTDDPNELLHYGVKGMKWGQHIFGKEREHSAGYRRAASKLSSKARHGISGTTSHWKRNVSPAVLRAKAQIKAAKKQAHAFVKEQRFMKRAIQKARENRLKYGKLSDDQVRRVTDRLTLEQRARQLGGTENPSFRRRMSGAFKDGMVRGTANGSAAYVEEKFRAKARYETQKKYGAKLAKLEAKAQIKKNKKVEKAALKQERKNAFKRAEIENRKDFYRDRLASGERVKLSESRFNPFGTRVRSQNLAERRRLESENSLKREAYKRYVLGGKNGGNPNDILKRMQDPEWKNFLSPPKPEKTGAARKLPGTRLSIRGIRQSSGESANTRANDWFANQSAASYMIMRGPGNSGQRSVNRPYVRVRRRRNRDYALRG